MTEEERLERLVSETGEQDEEILKGYLEQAEQAVLGRRYPFVADRSSLEVPERYEGLMLRLAVTYWAKRGAEGESAHNEGGVSRTYESEGRLLDQVLPYIGQVSAS